MGKGSESILPCAPRRGARLVVPAAPPTNRLCKCPGQSRPYCAPCAGGLREWAHAGRTVAVVHADRFNLRSLYLYAVCLVTLLISLFSLTQMVRHAVELAYPDPYSYSVPVPDEALGDSDKNDAAAARQKSEEERGRAASRRWAILGLVSSGTTLAVAAPVYLYHWRRVQRDRREVSPNE